MTTYIYTSNKNILKVNVQMTMMKLQKQGRKSNYSNPYIINNPYIIIKLSYYCFNILKVNVQMTMMKLQKQGRKSNYSNPYIINNPYIIIKLSYYCFSSHLFFQIV